MEKFKVFRDNKDIKLPTKAHSFDAGFDLYSPEKVDVPENGSAVIDTKIHIDIPEGYVGFLKSKSGLNVKHSITGEGVIDSGYTGSIVVKLYNKGPKYTFEKGDKLIQLVILPIPIIELEEVDSIDEFETHSGREAGGFGSTGK